MKKIDYYAVQNPYKMPKWLGAALGGIFGVIAIGSVAAIVQITKSDKPPIAAVAAAPVSDPAVAAPVAAKKSAPVVAAATDEEPTTAVQPKSKHSSKHGSKSKKASMRLASAKKMPATSSAAGRATMLAKHDTKAKRNDKDALDKLLGL